MNIVVIGYNPSSGAYSYGSVSMWAANGWEYNGHNVQRFDRSEMEKLPKKADIYFFVDVSEDYSEKIPDDLDGLKVAWLMDCQMPGGVERSRNIALKMDYVFCTNKIHGVDILDKFGVESTWVTYGYDHTLQKDILKEISEYDLPYIPGINNYKYDVCMIGNPNSPERVSLWGLLKQKYGGRVYCGTVDNREEYIKVKANSHIVISQPTEPFNNIINLRVFNALACGKLLLTKRSEVNEYEMLGMRDGINLVYWDNFDDLIEKVDYYLANPEIGTKIALEGRKLGDKYLMPNQVRFIEQTLLSKFYSSLEKSL